MGQKERQRKFHDFVDRLEDLEGMMNKEEMLKKISELESINDQLQAEIRYLDHLLREVGFEEGLKTLKFAAQELIEQDRNVEDN